MKIGNSNKRLQDGDIVSFFEKVLSANTWVKLSYDDISNGLYNEYKVHYSRKNIQLRLEPIIESGVVIRQRWQHGYEFTLKKGKNAKT